MLIYVEPCFEVEYDHRIYRVLAGFTGFSQIRGLNEPNSASLTSHSQTGSTGRSSFQNLG